MPIVENDEQLTDLIKLVLTLGFCWCIDKDIITAITQRSGQSKSSRNIGYKCVAHYGLPCTKLLRHFICRSHMVDLCQRPDIIPRDYQKETSRIKSGVPVLPADMDGDWYVFPQSVPLLHGFSDQVKHTHHFCRRIRVKQR